MRERPVSGDGAARSLHRQYQVGQVGRAYLRDVLAALRDPLRVPRESSLWSSPCNANQTPHPDVVAQARADFGEMIITPEVVAAHPIVAPPVSG